MANIMIVDDSPIFRRSLREIIETMGHQIVKELEDGREAIEKYNAKDVDLITMDIQLPKLDGIEALRQIRERNPNVKIVMISSLEQRSKVYEAIKQGAKHYITKPFTKEKVNEVINAVLGVQSSSIQEAPAKHTPVQKEDQAGRFPKKQELLKLEPLYMSNIPFELVIKDGRSVLTIQRHIVDMNVRFLCSCLQGLLYFRKMKYVVEMWEPVLHEEGLRLLLDFVTVVRERKGTVALVTNDLGYYSKLKARLLNGVYRSYAEIEW